MFLHAHARRSSYHWCRRCCCCRLARQLAAACQHSLFTTPPPPTTTTICCLPCPPLPRLLQADLIGKGKETATDRKMRQLLHRQWADAQDDKELAQVMRGLKNGFRRRHGAGFLDDDVSRLLGAVLLGCGGRLWCVYCSASVPVLGTALTLPHHFLLGCASVPCTQPTSCLLPPLVCLPAGG